MVLYGIACEWLGFWQICFFVLLLFGVRAAIMLVLVYDDELACLHPSNFHDCCDFALLLLLYVRHPFAHYTCVPCLAYVVQIECALSSDGSGISRDGCHIREFIAVLINESLGI